MKPVYQCEWCTKQGTAEEISEHEKTCVHNKNLRSCFTCASRKGFVTHAGCQLGIHIPEGKYMEHCSQWQEGEEKKIETTEDIFDVLFGSLKK